METAVIRMWKLLRPLSMDNDPRGPSQYNIASATQARTSVNNPAEGVYEFELQVTDSLGCNRPMTLFK